MFLRTKRIVCLLLLLVMVVAMAIQAIPASAAESGLTNVARGCKYTSPAPYTTDVDKNPGTYREKKGNELTDGVKGSSLIGPEWYAFNGASSYTVTVDLGSVKSDLARVAGEFCEKNDYAISLPTKVAVSISKDGSSFTDMGEAKDTTKAGEAYHNYQLDLPEGTSARYVRLTMTSGGFFTFLSEVEVFAGYISDVSFRDDTVYFEDDGTICVLRSDTSVADFLAMFNTSSGVTIRDADGKEKKEGLIATGDTVEKRQASGNPARWPVVIFGDLNKDGKVDGVDYMLLKRFVLETYQLSGATLLAADVNYDGKTGSTDYMLLKRHVLSTYNIYQKPEVVVKDGRGDVTSEFKDMDTTDTIKTLTSHPMTLKRVAENTYTMSCEVYGGTLTLNLGRTGWGTFNLGRWQLVDGNGTQTFVTGGTDWEYVYRVASSANGGWVWSGGNHANEKMRSLKLYDGKTGKEFSLAVGESASMDNLKIVEETTLYWDPAGDDGKYNYGEEYRYCNAVRTYTIVGPQIRLAVDYDYLKDAYYDLSYTCMFPIEKKYGLYCAFLDGKEKLLSVFETYKTGKADYSGAYHGHEAAERCIMWGYDGRETYKFDVRVLTPETSCNSFNNKDKVFFWDMNTATNKLYFSKFPSGSGKEKVAAGSKIHTECQWTFYE